MDTEEANCNSCASWKWISGKKFQQYEWIEGCDEFDFGLFDEELFREARTHEDKW